MRQRDRGTRVATIMLMVATGIALTSPLQSPGVARATDSTPVLVDRASIVGIAKVTETWSANAVDYNTDGLTDLWIGYHDWGGALYRNTGSNSMVRVNPGAWPRAVTKSIHRHSCTWGDANGDGHADQYCTVGRTSQNRVKTNAFDNELWLGSAAGTFTEVGTAVGRR